MAIQINTGNAQTVAQVDTFTVTYAASSSWSVTINAKTVTVATATDSTITTSATAAASLQAALSSSSAPLEFRQITWTNTTGSNVVTGTGFTSTLGAIPFTATVAHTGGGANLTHSTITAATGPNYWTDVNNWSLGTLPVSADDVFFVASSSAAVQYGLAQGGVVLNSLQSIGWSGQWGLPQINTGGYPEYNPTELAISWGSLNIDPNSGPTLARLNAGTSGGSSIIWSTGATSESGLPAVTIAGGNTANNLTLVSGSLGIAWFENETSSLASGLTVGQPNNTLTPPTIAISSGCARVGTTTFNAGIGTSNSPNHANAITQHGGALTIAGTTALATATIKTGTLFWNSTGTLANVSLIPDNPGATAVLDLSTAQTARTITNLTMAGNTTFNDPNHLGAVSTLTLSSGTTMGQLTLNNGAGRVYTPVS